MKNVNAYTGPQRFAHRGLVQAAPENTLGAFQGAVDGGYEGIEIDVQMTRDGEIVIAHDSNFTRMTLGHPDGGSNRRIRDLTWDEIQKIELPYANHLLSEVLPEHSEINCWQRCQSLSWVRLRGGITKRPLRRMGAWLI